MDSHDDGNLSHQWLQRLYSDNPAHSVARSQVNKRLEDVRTARTKEKSDARVSRALSGSLTFAQVVLGGVLASSFVQEALSPKVVGVFGVLVLIASLVKQQYRPEVDAEKARENALIALTHKISSSLTEIENPEAITPKLVHTKALPEPEKTH